MGDDQERPTSRRERSTHDTDVSSERQATGFWIPKPKRNPEPVLGRTGLNDGQQMEITTKRVKAGDQAVEVIKEMPMSEEETETA